MWKYRIMYVLVLIVTAVIFIGTNEKQPLLLLVLLCILPVLSFLLAKVQMNSLQVQMQLPPSTTMGRKSFLSVLLRKSKGIFLGRIIIPISTENIMFRKIDQRQLVINPGTGREERYEYPVQTQICGKIKVHVTHMHAYDLLGLWNLKKPLNKELVTTIYPAVTNMNLWLKQTPRTIETGDLYDQDVRGQDTSEVFDMREYQAGDSIRTIHWKLSSKRDELVVREFSRPANYNTIVLFDLAFFYGKEKISEEVISYVASLTASVSDSLLKQNIGHRVECILGNGMTGSTVTSPDEYQEMLTNMMSMTVSDQVPDIIQMFIKLELYRQYTKVIYVTGKLQDKLLADLENLVSLSVIIPTEEAKDNQDNSAGFDVISLAIHELRKTQLNIYI